MTTQLQRAYGIKVEHQPIPRGSEAKAPKKEVDKKAKGDPFEGLPRSRMIVDKKESER